MVYQTLFWKQMRSARLLRSTAVFESVDCTLSSRHDKMIRYTAKTCFMMCTCSYSITRCLNKARVRSETLNVGRDTTNLQINARTVRQILEWVRGLELVYYISSCYKYISILFLNYSIKQLVIFFQTSHVSHLYVIVNWFPTCDLSYLWLVLVLLCFVLFNSDRIYEIDIAPVVVALVYIV